MEKNKGDKADGGLRPASWGQNTPGSRTDEAKRLLDSGVAGSWLRERAGHRRVWRKGQVWEALGFGLHRMF